MAQQTFEELVVAVKQAESRGKRYKDDNKTLTTSPKGALGEMQVMPKTITNPGFGVTPAKDKSADEIARVGVDYLQAMKQKYGDTDKALVAYNMGPGATDKWIAAGAKTEALPAETKTYVERVKGFLGGNASRETAVAKKEVTPAEEVMTKALPAGTTAQATFKNMPDMANMPASYQAAFALAALADAKDEEDDKAFDENKETEAEKLMRDYKPVNHFASLDLGVTPVMMAGGGEVGLDGESEGSSEDSNINFFNNVNRMKDQGITTDSVMLGASKKLGDGSLMGGLNMANMSKDEKLQTARALMLAYTQQDPEGLGINANVVKPLSPSGPSMKNLMGSLPLGEGRVSAGLHGNKAYSLGYSQPIEGGQFNANLNVPRNNPSAAQLNLQYSKRFADGGAVYRAEGSPEEGEDVSKPYFGNPNISRQAGQARRNAAIQKASYRDELADAKDTARKGEAYQALEQYLQSRNAVPDISVSSYLPEGTHGLFSSDRTNIGTGNIKVNKNVHETYMPSTIAHEMTHAADRQMMQQAMEQGMFGKSNQFTEAYEKMVGPEGRNRTLLLRKRYPEFEEDNRYYRADPKELVAHAVGAYSGPALQDRAPRHVDATAATEFQILMDLAQRNVDKGPKGLEKIPAFFRKLSRYADGGEVEPTAEEIAAASTPAFIAQKSGIGRKEGNISKALQSGEGQKEFLKGMTNVPQNIVGAPMDISNMIANVYGGGVEKPFMGSEYIKEGLRAKGLGFTPSTDPTLAGFYAAGDLGSNLVNPAGVTRAGVQAAEKTGEAAKMLARDFQGYNQQLAVPGASYAVRNKGTPFIMTPERTTVSRQVVPEMNEADAYADKLARFVDTGAGRQTDNPALADWFRSKVGAYLRRDFGTEQDQMVQAADKGLKMHFMSPRFLEDRPYALSRNIGMDREREGFPKAGFAKTAKGQEAEAIIDSSIYPVQLQDVPEKYVPPNMKQFIGTNPEMRLSEMGTSVDENLKLEKLADEMDKMFNETVFKAYGEQVPMPKDYVLTEKTLEGLTPAQASNRVALKQEWAAKKQAEFAGVAIVKDPKIVSHSYDNGSKWISPADLADNSKHAEMVKDIGCAGGWCTNQSNYALDAGSGDNRLNILLDKKFEPRVQLTVNNPTPSIRDFATYMSEMGDNSVATKLQTSNYGWNTAGGRNSMGVDALVETELKAMPEYQDFLKQNKATKNITEIKGQFNSSDLRNSPYLKQIQDFVKRQGPELQSVDNQKGIRMVDMRDIKSVTHKINGIVLDDNLLNKFLKVNGNSYFADENEYAALIKKASEMPNNAARQIQMNLFQPSAKKAYGGMIERQPNDNRRYL
jgi:hypothetical protein